MKNLRICFTTDTHGYVFPTNYHKSNCNDMQMGLLKLISAFNKCDNTLLIDGGDTMQGSAFALYLSKQNFKQNPIAKLMNIANYDFVCLGNHDFNYGIDYLSNYINSLNAKCLVANISDKQNKLNIAPYSIKTMPNGLRVGVVGICTHHILRWEKQSTLDELNIKEPIDPLKKAYQAIQNQVDISICIYHGGFENDIDTGEILSTSDENQAYKIAQECGFDILLTGHQHMDIQGQYINSTYCVQTNANAQNFCEIIIDYSDNKIQNISSKLLQPAQTINLSNLDYFNKLQAKAEQWLDKPIGTLSQALVKQEPLHMALYGSFIANFFNQVQINYSGAMVSACSMANEIKGFNKHISIRDIVSTYVYSNTLLVLQISGKTLKEYMEKTASYFDIVNGEPCVSESFTKPKLAHYNYDYFYGINYEFDITMPYGNRLIKLEMNGKPISDTQTISIIMNNYRASGTGGYNMLLNQPIIRDIQQEVSTIIIEALEATKVFEIDTSICYKVLY